MNASLQCQPATSTSASKPGWLTSPGVHDLRWFGDFGQPSEPAHLRDLNLTTPVRPPRPCASALGRFHRVKLAGLASCTRCVGPDDFSRDQKLTRSVRPPRAALAELGPSVMEITSIRVCHSRPISRESSIMFSEMCFSLNLPLRRSLNVWSPMNYCENGTFLDAAFVIICLLGIM